MLKEFRDLKVGEMAVWNSVVYIRERNETEDNQTVYVGRAVAFKMDGVWNLYKSPLTSNFNPFCTVQPVKLEFVPADSQVIQIQP